MTFSDQQGAGIEEMSACPHRVVRPAAVFRWRLLQPRSDGAREARRCDREFLERGGEKVVREAALLALEEISEGSADELLCGGGALVGAESRGDDAQEVLATRATSLRRKNGVDAIVMNSGEHAMVAMVAESAESLRDEIESQRPRERLVSKEAPAQRLGARLGDRSHAATAGEAHARLIRLPELGHGGILLTPGEAKKDLQQSSANRRKISSGRCSAVRRELC